MILTPFLFYVYKYAPSGADEWDTIFGTIKAGNFSSVKVFAHTLSTKITFIIITGIWYFTSRNWWRFAILVPFTMFLFQLVDVLNRSTKYIDEFDFWYSLPVVLPIIFLMIYISLRLHKKSEVSDLLKEEADEELKNIFSDKL
ncbi:hypothetical protein [Aureisphaera galaxeae]|uniref:hypothetical protein n=1 Tax=Aureisphaera galaxeae TaxID=1538023 RepID=UPI0023510299|nr:hypothetical protein [Aureisphaera galaxeae]